MKYREGEIRIPSGCAISAVISREGRLTNGETIIKSMVPMHERSNGLGGGFAAYGIYPEHKDEFALHIFFDDNTSRRECEAYIKEMFELVLAEDMPVKIIPEITDMPIKKGILFRRCALFCSICSLMNGNTQPVRSSI